VRVYHLYLSGMLSQSLVNPVVLIPAAGNKQNGYGHERPEKQLYESFMNQG